jgi:hypothetical protein
MKASGTLLYVGPLSVGGTCRARLETFAALGWNILPFDIAPYLRMGVRVERSVAMRLHWGRAVSRLNADLARLAETAREPVRLIWIDKGIWIYPETLGALKRRFGCPAVHYTPDAQIHWQRSRHFLASLPLYETCVTTKEWEIADYRASGARKVLLTLQGYGDHFDRGETSPEEEALYGSGVGFIGHYQPHYAGRLKALAEAGVDLRVWGDAWHRRAASTPWLRGRTGPGLFGPSYPAALRAMKIGLGLLGKHIPETTTTRSFEIPAVGTFLLAERTDMHRELFEEGVEAEFFAGDAELVDKARFYLANPGARERIAAAGYARTRRSGYSASNLLAKLLEELDD